MQGPEHGQQAKAESSHDGVHNIFFLLSFVGFLIVLGNCYKGCDRVRKHKSDVIPQIEQRSSGIVVEFYKPKRKRKSKLQRHFSNDNTLKDKHVLVFDSESEVEVNEFHTDITECKTGLVRRVGKPRVKPLKNYPPETPRPLVVLIKPLLRSS